ncbi:predicted protein [Naegleria gruberi]|uniref:Predicted protein n=1 Tax=Naegleria gruberi TaxID=5762 RepID=D2VF16_NAEGR|nr:uncharacterized protein NAEGRDRAFT_79703 [Naegleria gruberi]EFC44604.1 predicted protein [Naegleria gruberi]|eukprot:XP_002677348.1 predicted protein [Naegleria gruberi strain NEG-M]
MLDVQSSLQDSKTIHELSSATTPQQQLFGKGSSSSTSLVLPLTGLNLSNNNTTSNSININNNNTNGLSSNSSRQYVSDTTSVQTNNRSDSSNRNRIGLVDYTMSDSKDDDTHLLMLQHSTNNNTNPQQVSSILSNTTSTAYQQQVFHSTAPTQLHGNNTGHNKILSSNNDSSIILPNVSSQLSNSNMFVSCINKSANSVHFNNNQSMSNMQSDTMEASEGIFMPNSQNSRNSTTTGLVSNNSTMMHVAFSTQKNMQNGQPTCSSSSSLENQHQPQHALQQTNVGINSTNPNYQFLINQMQQTPSSSSSSMRMLPNATLNMQLNANISSSLQMVNNQTTTTTNFSNSSSNIQNIPTTFNSMIVEYQTMPLSVSNQTNQLTSIGMHDETMLKLDLEDFVNTLHSEEYRVYMDMNNLVSNSYHSNSIVVNHPSQQHPLTSSSNLPQQQISSLHVNPPPNFVPSSNLLNNPNLSNIANNNLHIISSQQQQLQPININNMQRVVSLNLATIVKIIPISSTMSSSNQPTLTPQLVSNISTTTQKIIPPPPPTSVNIGNNANVDTPREYVIHENEYDRKKTPKSKKRQSIDYCNQKKMEFKMEISTKHPQPNPVQVVVTSSSSVSTPQSNTTPTTNSSSIMMGQYVNNNNNSFYNEPQMDENPEENK